MEASKKLLIRVESVKVGYRNMCHFKNQTYLFIKHLYMRTFPTLLMVPTSLDYSI